MMFHQKFRVQPNKQTGWKRLVGQEVPVEGFSDLMSINGTSFYAERHTNALATGARPASISGNASVNARKRSKVVFGPQTPQATQPILDLWVPLLFWFNRDHRLSIASVSIPYGQRFITIDLEQQSNIVFTAPGNLYLRMTTEIVTATGADKGKVTGAGITTYVRNQSFTPILATGSTVNTNQTISLELYINNIFVNPEINIGLKKYI
jgi:hypothetical protein